jgi:Flp pilus assembly protein TadD
MPGDTMPAPAGAPTPWKRHVAPVVGLVLLTLAAMGPVAGGEFLNWDDHYLLQHNPDYNPPNVAAVKRFWTETRFGFYIPLAYTTWSAVAVVGQTRDDAGRLVQDPSAFHGFNLLLHIGCALLVYAVVAKLLRAWCGGRGHAEGATAWAAVAGAAVFAVHPIQVEAIAWATNMYTPLSTLLALGALWLYLKFSDGVAGRGWMYAAATALFVLSTLAKPSTIVLPLIAAVIELALRGRRWRDVATPLGAWLALAMLPAVATALMPQHGSTVGGGVPPWARPLVAGDIVSFYLAKLLLPYDLAPDYGRSPRWLMARPAILFTAWIVPASLLLAAWLGRRRWPWGLASLLVFLLGVAPMLGLKGFDMQFYSSVADRYVYLAMLGAALGVGWAMSLAAGRKSVMAWAAAAVVLLAFVVLTHAQARRWHDTVRLFSYTLQVNSRSAIANRVLGFVLSQRGEYDRAADLYHAALRTLPDDPLTLYNLGNLRLAQRRYAEAVELYRRVPRTPKHAAAQNNLGIALFQLGDASAAEAAFVGAQRLDPHYQDAADNLARLRARLSTPPATTPATTPAATVPAAQ